MAELENKMSWWWGGWRWFSDLSCVLLVMASGLPYKYFQIAFASILLITLPIMIGLSFNLCSKQQRKITPEDRDNDTIKRMIWMSQFAAAFAAADESRQTAVQWFENDKILYWLYNNREIKNIQSHFKLINLGLSTLYAVKIRNKNCLKYENTV